MRDKKKYETDKKRYIKRDEIDQKEYSNKLKFSQKRAKDCCIQRSNTLIKMKRITFFSQTNIYLRKIYLNLNILTTGTL